MSQLLDCASADIYDKADEILLAVGTISFLVSFPGAIRMAVGGDHTEAAAGSLRTLPCGAVVVQIGGNNVEEDSVPVGDDILRDQPLLSALLASRQTSIKIFLNKKALYHEGPRR